MGNSELTPKLHYWVPWICEVFAPYIIQCTLDSVDHTENRIFGLPPYEEHIMLLELRKWEKNQLRTVTSELIEQGLLTTLAGVGKVCYPSLLLSLMGGHPGCPLRHDNLGHVTRCKVSSHGHPGCPLPCSFLGHVTWQSRASPRRHPGHPTPICSTLGQIMSPIYHCHQWASRMPVPSSRASGIALVCLLVSMGCLGHLYVSTSMPLY